jgi:glutaminyl-peptide cyclotransferase
MGVSAQGGRARRLGVVLTVVTFAAACATTTPKTVGPEPRVFTPRVVARFPHDPAAFTQGLAFDRGTLFESTGLYGHSELRRVTLSTGRVEQRRQLSPAEFGEGLTAHAGRLIQLTWRERTGHVYDRDTFRPTGRFGYQSEGWGIATAGSQLLMTDGSATLSTLDPATFRPRHRLRVTAAGRPVEGLNELEYIRGTLLANVWPSSRIARIDPRTGEVTAWYELAGLAKGYSGVANGIGYDDTTGRLYLTGKNWPTLFEVTLPGLATAGRPPR